MDRRIAAIRSAINFIPIYSQPCKIPLARFTQTIKFTYNTHTQAAGRPYDYHRTGAFLHTMESNNSQAMPTAAASSQSTSASTSTSAPAVTTSEVTPSSQSSSLSTSTSDSASAGGENDFYTPVFPAALLTPLSDMGFTHNRCVRALHATGGVSVDVALQWIFEHVNEVDIDEPLRIPRQIAEPAAAPNPSSGRPTSSSPSSSSSSFSSSASSFFHSLLRPSSPMKLVLLVRLDLRMRTGKIAAQVAHAAVGTVISIQRLPATHQHSTYMRQWLSQGQAKVALGIPNESAMMELQQRATEAGLHTFIVSDAGRTQVEAGSLTVLAIGPGPIHEIDQITGHLKLL